MRVAQKMSRSWRKSLFQMGMEGLLYPMRKNGDMVLMYHGIDRTGDKRYNLRHVSRVDLRRQLRYLRKEYTVVPLEELFTVPNRGGRRLAITFDDGLENNFLHAAPVLRNLSLPATFFATSLPSTGQRVLWPDAVQVLTAHGPSKIELFEQSWQRQPWNRFTNSEGIVLTEFLQNQPWESVLATQEALVRLVGKTPEALDPLHARLMDDDQLRTLARHPLFEIGAHGHTHLPLGKLSPEAQRAELSTCKQNLEQILQKPVHALAYPLGSYQRQTLDVAESLGFSRQLAVNYQFPEDANDPRMMARFGTVEDRSWLEQLHQINQRFHAEPYNVEA